MLHAVNFETYRRASPSRRTLAFVVDILLFALLLGLGWILLTWALASRGQTPGKAMTGISVTQADGTRLGTGWFLLREVVFKMIIGPITFEFSTLFGGMQVWWDGSPWWDRLVGSVVLERASTVSAVPEPRPSLTTGV